MDLDDFVKLTIAQIVDGVSAAQEATVEKGANVNPLGLTFKSEGKWNSHQHGALTNVEFNVALTSSEGSSTAGGIGVFLGTVNLGSKGSSESESVAQTSVKFSVPLLLPPGQEVG